MISLLVVSSEVAAGKTAICAGIARHLAGAGKKVGYFRPAVNGGSAQALADATFMKQALGLSEAPELFCPSFSPDDLMTNKLKEAYLRISGGKDVVIVEAPLGQSPDDGLTKAIYQMAGALEAKVIAVETYPGRPTASISRYKGFGGNLLGMVLNKVPRSRLKRAQDEILPQYKNAGVNILGVIPEDRLLLAPTIGEMANSVGGKILNSAEKSAELVENLLAGALTVDSGLNYFGRKANKAAIVKSDRPDMQLAALETSTKCLLLTGKSPVYYRVIQAAGSKGIPLIQTEGDTNSILARIEQNLVGARFAQTKKLPRLAEVMQQSFDFTVMDKGMGLAK